MIGIKGAGEMASAVAGRLYMANCRRIFMMEIPSPLAVRRAVSFCEAVHEGRKTIEEEWRRFSGSAISERLALMPSNFFTAEYQ